jgi:23S rRNA (adenine1618-N6)-methyltransferase
LKGLVELRLQSNDENIFKGIIKEDEFIDLTICNPPFHASLAEATAGTLRKLSSLTQKKITNPKLNFGGQNRELWVEGGEAKFVGNIIRESREFWSSCLWFSTNISKQSNLQGVYSALQNVEAVEVKTIPMGQGNKISRIVAWTFLNEKQQKGWRDLRWNHRKG